MPITKAIPPAMASITGVNDARGGERGYREPRLVMCNMMSIPLERAPRTARRFL